MSFGSRSAQTPSESSQQSPSNQLNGGDAFAMQIAGDLLNNGGKTYHVFHKWRKVGSIDAPGPVHHSQIFIMDPVKDVEVMNFGLFGDQNGKVVFGTDGAWDAPDYHTSTTYRPNPVKADGATIVAALKSCAVKCGPEYKLLHNNCQKYARLVMTSLGAKHHRDPFHP